MTSQGTGWYDIVLEEEEIDEIYGYKGEDECINPRHDKPYRRLGIFPPLPVDFLRDIAVVDEWHYNESEPTLQP